MPPRHRGPGRADDQRVPRPPRTSAGQHHPQPQRRLAAIHSLFSFAALRHPEHAADIARVLAIPPKRGDQTIVTFLASTKTKALLAVPDRTTQTGRRDHAWILLAIQTGLRASELTALTRRDVRLGAGAYVACHGKGRKDRITPLAPGTVTTLPAAHRTRRDTGRPAVHHHPRGPITHDALQQRLALYATAAQESAFPTLTSKNMHTPRPTALSGHGIAARRDRRHRVRHQPCCQHYPNTVVMPIPGGPVLAGGGERVLDIGIIERAAA